MNSAIQQLCKINYGAIELYKEVIDVSRERQIVNDFQSSQKLVYAIVNRIEYYLEHSNFNISDYEQMMHDNDTFFASISIEKSNLEKLRESINLESSVNESQSMNKSSNSISQQSKSHSRFLSKYETASCIKPEFDYDVEKNTLTTDKVKIKDHSEIRNEKSRNHFKGSLSSRHNNQEITYSSVNRVKEDCVTTLKKFDKNIFMTAETQKRRTESIDKSPVPLNIEMDALIPEFDKLISNYRGMQNEIKQMAQLDSDICIDGRILNIAHENVCVTQAKTLIEHLDTFTSNNKMTEAKIDKLLENLSIMILSKKSVNNIDQDSCEFIQKLFGDKALVKILKHIDTFNRKSKGTSNK